MALWRGGADGGGGRVGREAALALQAQHKRRALRAKRRREEEAKSKAGGVLDAAAFARGCLCAARAGRGPFLALPLRGYLGWRRRARLAGYA